MFDLKLKVENDDTIRSLKINHATIVTGIILLCTFVTFLLFSDNRLRTLTLYLLLSITYFYNKKITILYIIASALAGTIGEIFLMNFAKNTWYYQKPNFFGTPSWLPPLWAIACIGALEIFVITNNINYLVNKK